MNRVTAAGAGDAVEAPTAAGAGLAPGRIRPAAIGMAIALHVVAFSGLLLVREAASPPMSISLAFEVAAPFDKAPAALIDTTPAAAALDPVTPFPVADATTPVAATARPPPDAAPLAGPVVAPVAAPPLQPAQVTASVATAAVLPLAEPVPEETVPDPAPQTLPLPATEAAPSQTSLSATPRAVARPRPALARPRPRTPAATGPTEQALPATPGPAVARPAAAFPASAAESVAAIGPDWRNSLGTWLQGHRTYPDDARRRGEEGRAVVRFTTTRDGRVLEFALVTGTGSEALDDAVRAMFRGAQLPAFPASMRQDQVTVTVPIRFTLER